MSFGDWLRRKVPPLAPQRREEFDSSEKKTRYCPKCMASVSGPVCYRCEARTDG